MRIFGANHEENELDGGVDSINNGMCIDGYLFL